VVICLRDDPRRRNVCRLESVGGEVHGTQDEQICGQANGEAGLVCTVLGPDPCTAKHGLVWVDGGLLIYSSAGCKVAEGRETFGLLGEAELVRRPRRGRRKLRGGGLEGGR